VHHQKLGADHVKVSVDMILDGAEELPLPVGAHRDYTRLSDVAGSFLQWPKTLVLEREVIYIVLKSNLPINELL
jgi:hypothetical protein